MPFQQPNLQVQRCFVGDVLQCVDGLVNEVVPHQDVPQRPMWPVDVQHTKHYCFVVDNPTLQHWAMVNGMLKMEWDTEMKMHQ